jgi:hypothetical protein
MPRTATGHSHISAFLARSDAEGRQAYEPPSPPSTAATTGVRRHLRMSDPWARMAG